MVQSVLREQCTVRDTRLRVQCHSSSSKYSDKQRVGYSTTVHYDDKYNSSAVQHDLLPSPKGTVSTLLFRSSNPGQECSSNWYWQARSVLSRDCLLRPLKISNTRCLITVRQCPNVIFYRLGVIRLSPDPRSDSGEGALKS